MDKETARQILKDRKVGFERLRRFEIEEEAGRTTKDRLDDLNFLVGFTRELGIEPTETLISPTWRRWQRLRNAYERSR
jgi:hypothetical protein